MNREKSRPHALVIGGSSGIGEAIAKRLVSFCNVSVRARRLDRLNAMKQSHPSLHVGVMDVTRTEELEHSIRESVDCFGLLDIAIYCAGHQVIKPHRTIGDHEIEKLFDVNLKGAMHASRLFCKNAISEKNAVMCFVSSVAGVRPEPGIVDYAVMKGGLNTLIRGLARECGPRRFVGVAPGWLDTEMTRAQSLYSASFVEALGSKSPVGLASVEGVVHAVEFLTSPRAASITGQIITVDGGASL